MPLELQEDLLECEQKEWDADPERWGLRAELMDICSKKNIPLLGLNYSSAHMRDMIARFKQDTFVMGRCDVCTG